MKKLNKILIYLFVTIFFACSTPKQKEFERTKENETKENSLQPESCSPSLFGTACSDTPATAREG